MGIQGQNQILYLSDKLNFAHICALLQKGPMMPSASSTSISMENNSMNRRPCVVIDANQVGMKFLKGAPRPMSRIVGLARLFATAGIDAVIAVDGAPSNKDSKYRASR